MKKDLLYIFYLCLMLVWKSAMAIDCYVCSSLNDGNKECEDTFEKDLTTEIYIARKCYFGFFKAKYCIKLKGTKEDGSTILVRQCSDGDWGSHCGDIKYEIGENYSETVYGCLETCDYDGCNSSNTISVSIYCGLIVLSAYFLLHRWLS